MKVPTASLSSILTPEKLNKLESSCVKTPFLKAKLSKLDEDSQQLLVSQTKLDQAKDPKINTTSLARLENPEMETTRGKSLQRPKFTISNVSRNLNNVCTSTKKVEETILRRPVASLQKITSQSMKDDDGVFGFSSFSQSLNVISSCSPTSSDPVEEVADQPYVPHRTRTSLAVLSTPLLKVDDQPPMPLRRQTSLPVLSTPLQKVRTLPRPKSAVKRLFSKSQSFRRRKLEVQKTDLAINTYTPMGAENKETSTYKLQCLEESVDKLATKLAAISLKADNMHRESAFYKTIIFRIENVIARSQDQSVFSSLRITNF